MKITPMTTNHHADERPRTHFSPRVANTNTLLSDHPIPPESFNMPFVSRYVDVAQEDLSGFSTNPVIYFRFSHAFDVTTIDAPDLIHDAGRVGEPGVI